MDPNANPQPNPMPPAQPPVPAQPPTTPSGLPPQGTPPGQPSNSFNTGTAKKKRTMVIATIIGLAIIVIAAGTVFGLKLTKHDKPAAAKPSGAPATSNNAATTNGTNGSTPTTGAQSTTTPQIDGGADGAIDGFINAIRTSNKAAADALQDAAFAAENKDNFDTTSFYDSCAGSGGVCQTTFSSAYLDSGTKTTKDYKATDGTPGKQRVYTITKTSGSSKTVTTITIAAVQNGDKWYIDHFQQDDSSEADL